MLRLKSIHTYYGNIHALRGVSLHVNQGEIATLIGANGAGKTTVLKTISGLTPASRGSIAFEGQDITRMPTTESAEQSYITIESPASSRLSTNSSR